MSEGQNEKYRRREEEEREREGGKKKETTYPAVKETCIRPTEQGVSESKKKEE